MRRNLLYSDRREVEIVQQLSTKMRSAVILCTAVAVAAFSSMGANCIQSAPKWVDDAKLAYAAELKASLNPPLPVSSHNEISCPLSLKMFYSPMLTLEYSLTLQTRPWMSQP